MDRLTPEELANAVDMAQGHLTFRGRGERLELSRALLHMRDENTALRATLARYVAIGDFADLDAHMGDLPEAELLWDEMHDEARKLLEADNG